ncbi:FAD-binding oxidoreductase [Microbacterium sp. H1-D42]|uniref:FAD-binding oxidoreductase n=1 Tax=Microbacterium sp. H1-D42 TaxID=2925844 RepID=UPI001F53168D|nr:FAD-binding oxidoreductase [Microbacterium sp. H1-D42]UNK71139.1 FAD-binding oxidoreductase [Microbacterium sp. H1-D42]
MTLASTTDALRAIPGLHFPDEPGYDEHRQAWNLLADQHPLAIAVPDTIDDAVRVVRAVTDAGLRIAPQASGHGAAAIDGDALRDAVLLRLHRLTGVEVDAENRSARVLGGTLWNEVIAAAAPHGLTALHGSAGDVSVTGYILGAGISFYGRTHGLATHRMSAVELITATGEVVRATADEHSDLFWALRGGGGNFGAVVAVEIDLLPIPDVQAGFLLWDIVAASDVIPAWRDWTRGLDRAATTALRLFRFPPLPELPPFLSGRSLVIIDGAILGDDALAAELLEPLRALRPEMDTFARIPAQALLEVHMDPPMPSAAVTDHLMFGDLTDAAVTALLDAAGPGAEAAPMVVELRHLGGALGDAQDSAVRCFDGEYALVAVQVVPVPEFAPQAVRLVDEVVETLRPWADCAPYLNFVDVPVGAEVGFDAETIERLRRVREMYDPNRVWVAAHALPDPAVAV